MPGPPHFSLDRLADLARLELSHVEREELPAELEAIIGYSETMGDPDGEGVAADPDAAPFQSVTRSDQPSPCLKREQTLANAPRQDGEYFLVPPVFG